MSVFRITFLGTSAAAPTVRRGLSAIALRLHSDRLLVDCGEGTQRQMLRFGAGLHVDKVLFTHFHADHYLGIIGFLRTLSMGGRTEPITLCGPMPGLEQLLIPAVRLGNHPYPFSVQFEAAVPGAVWQQDGYSIRVVGVDHRIAAVGYVFEEPDRPGIFNIDKALALGLRPGPLFKELQLGHPVRMNGTMIDPKEVVGPPRPGRKLAISGDTRPSSALAEACKNCDLLIHEATFIEADRPRALETMHSTAKEAAQIAVQAHAWRLILTHISSRYDAEPDTLAAEAREVFSGPIEIAEDGLRVEIPLRDAAF